MKAIWLKRATVFASLMAFASACGEEPVDTHDEPTNSTADGVSKVVDGKSDAWNWTNDPARLRTQFDYVFDNLPSEAAVDHVNWAASYWPYYQDGINARWQGSSVLSPAEKYDAAFNEWTAPEGFMDLKPWNRSTCEFDQEYYDSLGPAATWTNRTRGTWRSHNGIDDDRDGVSDADECAGGEEADFDGVETWWGICHAWAPAAMLEEEPLRAVERNGVRFEVSDIKALLIQQYDRTNAYMVGGRCNERELERDEDGRIKRSECRDLNAGSWHVIVTNLIGKDNRSFVIERTTNYQVWNQPMNGYQVTSQREISLEEAHDLLAVEAAAAEEGNGVFVHDVEEESAKARAILEFVNTASLAEIDDDARLHSYAASNIVSRRPFVTLAELDAVPYVAAYAFGLLGDYVEAHDLVQKPDYRYNEEATRFVEIRMTTDWVTESHPSTSPMTPQASRYVRHDYYHYILELNDDGEILGGEWLGSSIENHPDFVWLPTAAISGNPNIDLAAVREMVRESRAHVDGGGNEPGNGEAKTFTSTDIAEIPDNDPSGVSSVLSIEENGTIRSVKLDLDIEHTYRGDLFVQLAHGGVAVTVYDGRDAGSGWEDDVNLSGQAVEGFLGANLSGEWELRAYDRAGADLGRIVSWSLHVETN